MLHLGFSHPVSLLRVEAFPFSAGCGRREAGKCTAATCSAGNSWRLEFRDVEHRAGELRRRFLRQVVTDAIADRAMFVAS
ncbi:hypothetical protein D3C87_2044660 [compost metagenome]